MSEPIVEIDVEPVVATKDPVDIDDPATWPEDFDD